MKVLFALLVLSTLALVGASVALYMRLRRQMKASGREAGDTTKLLEKERESMTAERER